VALVGAGPGSKDLITLRGVQRLQEADVVFYDWLVDPEVLDLARRDAERVYVGKAPGAHSMMQAQINGVVTCEIVSGVTAASAASAATGRFLTARGAIDTLVLTTARNETSQYRTDWPSQLHPGVRVAVYIGVAEAPRIQATLATHPWRDANHRGRDCGKCPDARSAQPALWPGWHGRRTGGA